MRSQIYNFIKQIYRFYYIGLYHRSAFELKSNTESSVGLFFTGLLMAVSTIMVTLVFKVFRSFGVFFEKNTIIITAVVFMGVDFLISTFIDRYISKNIIDETYIQFLDKEVVKYTKRRTLLIWFYSFVLSFSSFILFILSVIIMAKILNL